MRYRVLVKPSNTQQAWSSHGVYGSESVAQRLSLKYAFVRVVDDFYRVLWSR